MTADIKLNDGNLFPALSFGTGTTFAGQDDDLVAQACVLAFEEGFRHFDTAKSYKTETAVGKAIQLLIKEKNAKREEIYVTTKLQGWITTKSEVNS